MYDAMTSDRHSKGRKELNEKRTVALLSMMAFGLSQKCNTFQHDHGQLLNGLDYRVTPLIRREYWEHQCARGNIN